MTRDARAHWLPLFHKISGLVSCCVVATTNVGCTRNGGAPSDSGTGTSPGPCLTGAAKRTLYSDPTGGVVPQPTIAGDQVIAATTDSIVAVSLSTSDSHTLTAAASPSPPVVLNGQVYFQALETVPGQDAAGPQQSRTRLFVVPVSGGSATAVDMFSTSLPVAADDSALYLLNADTQSIDRWIPPSGNPSKTPIAGLQVYCVLPYGDSIYVAAQDLRVAGPTNGIVARAPKGGGGLTSMVTNIGRPANLAADAGGLYWTEDPPGLFGAGPGRVARSGLDGASPSTILEQDPVSLVVRNGQLIFSTGTEIDSMSTKGGTVTPIVSMLLNAGLLTVAGDYLVWIEPRDQRMSDAVPVTISATCL